MNNTQFEALMIEFKAANLSLRRIADSCERAENRALGWDKLAPAIETAPEIPGHVLSSVTTIDGIAPELQGTARAALAAPAPTKRRGGRK
jgi:hypothetical protein